MFEYRRPASWCPFLICTQCTVSGAAELMHSIVNTFFIQFLLHGGRAGHAMIIERDEGSDGWIAYEGKWNPETFEFERLRACFKCPDRGALDNGSYQGWFVNGARSGEDPDWGTSTMHCLSKWERE